MFDDARLEWLCQRTCQMLNVERDIFIEMLERNENFNEDLIDRFFNRKFDFPEHSFALLFHREISTRNIWTLIEILADDDEVRQTSTYFQYLID